MKIIGFRPLSSHVLAVAVCSEHNNNLWAVYISAVDGINHRTEAEDVATVTGTKTTAKIASAIFPEFKKLKYMD